MCVRVYTHSSKNTSVSSLRLANASWSICLFSIQLGSKLIKNNWRDCYYYLWNRSDAQLEPIRVTSLAIIDNAPRPRQSRIEKQSGSLTRIDVCTCTLSNISRPPLKLKERLLIESFVELMMWNWSHSYCLLIRAKAKGIGRQDILHWSFTVKPKLTGDLSQQIGSVWPIRAYWKEGLYRNQKKTGRFLIRETAVKNKGKIC